MNPTQEPLQQSSFEMHDHTFHGFDGMHAHETPAGQGPEAQPIGQADPARCGS